jgi:hypothetical protein
MLADEVDYVVGVDTHRDQHVLAVVVASSGGVIAQRSLRPNARGYAEALRFTGDHAPGTRIWAVEGAGQTIRHRLSRGGDRQLNRALHTVILHRRHHDPATRDYIARRVAEGKSTRDATRILKRYLARHLYRVMQNASPAMT